MHQTLTKAQIVEHLYTDYPEEFSKKEAQAHVEALLEIIKKTLESGEALLISGFGKFCVVEKAVRRGRNPATGDDMVLRKRRVVTFRCSQVLRVKVNGKGQSKQIKKTVPGREKRVFFKLNDNLQRSPK